MAANLKFLKITEVCFTNLPDAESEQNSPLLGLGFSRTAIGVHFDLDLVDGRAERWAGDCAGWIDAAKLLPDNRHHGHGIGRILDEHARSHDIGKAGKPLKRS